MEKKTIFDYIKAILSAGYPMPAPAFAFFLIALVSLLQIPSNLLMHLSSYPVGIIINEIVIIFAIPFIIIHFLKFDKGQLLKFKVPKIKLIIFSILLTIPAALLIDYGVSASELILPAPKEYHLLLNNLMSYSGTADFALKLFILCIAPGICEEFFFRGICQTTFEARWGKTIAIIITSFFFAILHGNPWCFHLYFVLGIFLGWVYAESGNLWIPIICHTANNMWTYINYTLGVEYPINGTWDKLNLLIISAAILVVFVLAVAFKSDNRQQTTDHRP